MFTLISAPNAICQKFFVGMSGGPGWWTSMFYSLFTNSFKNVLRTWLSSASISHHFHLPTFTSIWHLNHQPLTFQAPSLGSTDNFTLVFQKFFSFNCWHTDHEQKLCQKKLKKRGNGHLTPNKSLQKLKDLFLERFSLRQKCGWPFPTQSTLKERGWDVVEGCFSQCFCRVLNILCSFL